MSLPSTGNSGIINLTDTATRLHFINRALHILQLHSDEHGFLSISSSDKLLRTGLPQLADQQVRDINDALFTLGLRKTKPGGGEHIIRMDITRISREQLRAGKHIPIERDSIPQS